MWAVVLLIVLNHLGVNITALVAGLGIGGVAVALALQNVLGDLLASLAIVLDKPFVVGDSIGVGEVSGQVERVGIKTTRLRSVEGEQLVIANADLLKSRIRNFRRMTERRVQFALGIAYETPHDKLAAVPDILREIVMAEQRVRFDRAHFKGFGDSALLLEIVYFVLDRDYNGLHGRAAGDQPGDRAPLSERRHRLRLSHAHAVPSARLDGCRAGGEAMMSS